MNHFFVLLFVSTFFMAPVNAGDVVKGQALYEKNCVSCHGAQGEGNVEQKAPRLRGQHDWYVVTQLQNFKNGTRQNPPMLPFIKDLTEADMNDLGSYINKMK
jgi:cytochrome c553